MKHRIMELSKQRESLQNIYLMKLMRPSFLGGRLMMYYFKIVLIPSRRKNIQSYSKRSHNIYNCTEKSDLMIYTNF